MPKGSLARDAAQAKEIAARIGYPVVLKAQAAALAHKSDAGGVALEYRRCRLRSTPRGGA